MTGPRPPKSSRLRTSATPTAAAAFVCTVLGSAAVLADVSSAGALFTQGLAEMKAGRYETGCPAIAESHRLDPRPGALFTLAECEAAWGRVATALARYEDFVRLVGNLPPGSQAAQAKRLEVATAERDRLQREVPRLTLVLPASAPEGTVVTRDGTELGRPSLGVPLPIDPGDHVITTRAPGGSPYAQTVSIARGEQKRVELVVDVAPPAADSGAPAPVAEVAAEAGASSRRPWAFAVGGVGLAGLAVGTVTGIMTVSKKSTVDDHCVENVCDAEGKRAADSAQVSGWISGVGIGVGAAALAIGVVLLVTDPSAPHPRRAARSPSVRGELAFGPREAGAAVRGSF